MSFSGTNSDATVSSLAKSGDLHRNNEKSKEPPTLSKSQRKNANAHIYKTIKHTKTKSALKKYTYVVGDGSPPL